MLFSAYPYYIIGTIGPVLRRGGDLYLPPGRKGDGNMYAVIDIGSNTIRLVLYRVVDGEPRQVLSSKQAAGLAE